METIPTIDEERKKVSEQTNNNKMVDDLNNESTVNETVVEETELIINDKRESTALTIVEPIKELNVSSNLVIQNSSINLDVLDKRMIDGNRNLTVQKKVANTLVSSIRNYLSYEKAEDVTNKLLLENKIDSQLKVIPKNGDEDENEQHIFKLVLEKNSTNICDPIEPEKEIGVLSHDNYFDAIYTTNARGKVTMKIIYCYKAIIYMLKILTATMKEKINRIFLTNALAENIALSELLTSEISKVIEKLVEMKFLEEFNDFRLMIKKAKWKEKNEQKEISIEEFKAIYLLKDIAFVDNNGKYLIVDTSEKQLKFYSKSDLMMKFDNKRIEVLNEKTGNIKEVHPFTLYSKSKYRREYKRMVFEPNGTVDENTLNLFRGYKYKPKNLLDISLYKNFVKEVICNGATLLFMIIWSFLAQIFQKPHIKMGTSLILKSDKGAGKNTFIKPIAELMSGYFMTSSDNKPLLNNFNKHLETTILYYANEASFTTKKEMDGYKKITTEVDITSEVKGGDTYSTKNYTHLIIDANDNVPVVHTSDERRNLYADISNSKIGVQPYWYSLNELFATDGFYESLMFDFMNFDYTKYEGYLRLPPKNEVTQEQIELSFIASEAYWKDCLYQGRIPYVWYDLTSDNKLNITNEAKFRSFKKWSSVNGYKHSFTIETFGKSFNEKCLGVNNNLSSKGKITINQERKNSNVYEALSKCRDAFYKLKNLPMSDDANNDTWQLPKID